MNRYFVYDGVVSGKKVATWECPVVEKMVDNKKKMEPDTSSPEAWWKGTYTKENGAFWYKVNEVSR
jgi:hypothetical protein